MVAKPNFQCSKCIRLYTRIYIRLCGTPGGTLYARICERFATGFAEGFANVGGSPEPGLCASSGDAGGVCVMNDERCMMNDD